MLAAWQRFWFAPASLVDLGAARVVLATILLVLLWPARYLPLLRAPAELYAPVGVLRWLDVGPPTSSIVVPLATVAPWLLVPAGLGVCARPSLAAFAVVFLLLESWLNAFGKIAHGTIPLLFAVVAFALSPCDRAVTLRRLLRRAPSPPASRWARWPLELVWVELAAFYAAAGIAKVRHSGAAWADGHTLQYHLLARGEPAGLWLAEHLPLCAALSFAVLVFELAFPASIPLRTLRPIFLAGGVLFHAGTTLFLGITFWPVVALYAVFLPWEAMARRLCGAGRNRAEPAVAAGLG